MSTVSQEQIARLCEVVVSWHLRQYSTEVGEMVSVDPDDDSPRTHCQQVAWLARHGCLRQKLSNCVDQGECPEFGSRGLLDMDASRHIVSTDLNPVPWGTLPTHVLQLVLACLPVPDIPRLGSLSIEWRREMTTPNSDFTQACDEASPMMIAALSCELLPKCDGSHDPKFFATPGRDVQFFVTTCDLSKSSHKRPPHSYYLHRGHSSIVGPWNLMGAMDGGLIGFVSAWKPSKDKPLCIVVMNLLTRVQRKLPPLQNVYTSPPQMMHIEVDSKTKCYRVVVIDHATVEIYDSRVRQWTKTATPQLGFISGLSYKWKYDICPGSYRSTSPHAVVYDFAKGRFRCQKGFASHPMAFWKDCKFELHSNTVDDQTGLAENYRITKYRMHTDAEDWVQERLYQLCSSFEDLAKEYPDISWHLRGGEDFLMVFAYPCFGFKYYWLLDLSTEEWSKLPNCFQEHSDLTSMCRAFWNVAP